MAGSEGLPGRLGGDGPETGSGAVSTGPVLELALSVPLGRRRAPSGPPHGLSLGSGLRPIRWWKEYPSPNACGS